MTKEFSPPVFEEFTLGEMTMTIYEFETNIFTVYSECWLVLQLQLDWIIAQVRLWSEYRFYLAQYQRHQGNAIYTPFYIDYTDFCNHTDWNYFRNPSFYKQHMFQNFQITVAELLLIVILTLSSLFHFSLFILSCLSTSWRPLRLLTTVLLAPVDSLCRPLLSPW